jgi:uncharacterized protein
MESLRETKDGLILPIKVIPGASKSGIVGWHNGRLKVRICAPAEKGEANRAVVHFLSKTFEIPQSKIVLLKGASAREKEFLLIGFTQLELERLGLKGD